MNMVYIVTSSVLFLGILVQMSTLNAFEDFAFPLDKSDDFATACTFKNGSAGQCVDLSECPNAHQAYQLGIHPTLCRFAKTEPVVCCMKHGNTVNRLPLINPVGIAKTDVVQRRKSVAHCEDVYSLPVSFEPGEFHIEVVGGSVTAVGEFPHMAALGWFDRSFNIDWECGGTLISIRFVLTAAHCVIGRPPPDVIRIGEKDVIEIDLDSLPQDFGVESIVGHPNYKPNELYDDIALIKLDKNATITKKVRPACLWQGNAINFTDATATRHTEFGGKASGELLKVDLKIISNQDCASVYKYEPSLTKGIVNSQLCAGDSTGMKDTCQGDSGGPILVSTMNELQIVYHVVGITSSGSSCATTLPGVYIRVSHYLDYIESIVW